MKVDQYGYTAHIYLYVDTEYICSGRGEADCVGRWMVNIRPLLSYGLNRALSFGYQSSPFATRGVLTMMIMMIPTMKQRDDNREPRSGGHGNTAAGGERGMIREHGGGRHQGKWEKGRRDLTETNIWGYNGREAKGGSGERGGIGSRTADRGPSQGNEGEDSGGEQTASLHGEADHQ